MYGQTIPNVDEVKLLGITLDRKLHWNKHITERITACKKALMQLRPIIGKTWSPKPEYTRWLYKCVILPMLTYGCAVWARATLRDNIQLKLKRLQRLGLLSIAHARRGTPTAALEIIYDAPPLHLLVQETAIKTYLRLEDLHWEGQWHPDDPPNRIGHLRLLHSLIPEHANNDSDSIDPTPNFEQRFSVQINETHSTGPGIHAYTDGSLYKNQSGAGAYIEINGYPLISISERLPRCSVFQAELRAIQATCKYLNNTVHQEITFYVDSQAALKALQTPSIKSYMVAETKEMLDKLGEMNIVQLQWIKAHVGFLGNENADAAAKAGSQSSRYCTDNNIKTSRTEIKNILRDRRNQEWKHLWDSVTDCRQSKLFMEQPNKKIWQDIKDMRQKGVSSIVRFLTGHTFMNRHNDIIKYGKDAAADSPEANCRLCEEGEETPEHLITDCPCLYGLRSSTLYSWQLDRPPPWSTLVARFIHSDQIRQLEEDTQTNGM